MKAIDCIERGKGMKMQVWRDGDGQENEQGRDGGGKIRRVKENVRWRKRERERVKEKRMQ